MPRTPIEYVPKGYRRRLRRQSDRAADRIYGPEIQAYQNQKGRVRRQYRKDVRANRGTIAYTQDAISQVPLKGLRGSNRQMVAEEMALSSRDVAASLPFLNAEARATRGEAMADINTDILTARINRSKDAARRYSTELDQAGNRFLQNAKDEATDAADRRKRRRDRKIDLAKARRTVAILVAEAPKAVPWGEKAIQKFGSEDAAWLAFEHAVRTEGEVDDIAARKAVEAFRRRMYRLDRNQAGPSIFESSNPRIRQLGY